MSINEVFMKREMLITREEAAARSLETALLVGRAILTGSHAKCPGCAICDVIQIIQEDLEKKVNETRESYINIRFKL
jgi:hypothetical protein